MDARKRRSVPVLLSLTLLALLGGLPPAAAGAAFGSASTGVLRDALPNGQWSMFKNLSDRAGRTRLPGPRTANLKWRYDLASIGIQSAAVIGRAGTVYVGSVEGVLYAFRPDGSLKWQYPLSRRYQITATPAIGADGTIYLAPENGNLHALRPDGTLRWKFDLQGYGGPSSSPAVASDGTIYIGARCLYAVSAHGALRWRYDTGADIDGPPAIARDGTIYFSSGYYLYSLRPDGTLMWRRRGAGGYAVGSAPAIARDGTIYINTHDGVLHAVDPDGTLKWTYETEGIVTDVPSSPAVGRDGTVYFGGGGEYGGSGGYLYAVDPDGSLAWRFFAGCDQTAPSIGGDGTIYFGNNCGGTIYALSPDGALEWSYSMGLAYMRSSPAIGLGGRLYVGFLGYFVNGGLLAFGP